MVIYSMRIIKRKKGKKDYFYLQHSFREDGKVITREKYLGLIIPDEIGKIKKDFISKFKLKLYKKLDGIRKNFQAEWKNMSKDSLERVKEDIAIAFTYNTNAIEGSTIALEETREIIKEGYAPNKPLRDIRETESHNNVFLKMFEQK